MRRQEVLGRIWDLFDEESLFKVYALDVFWEIVSVFLSVRWCDFFIFLLGEYVEEVFYLEV